MTWPFENNTNGIVKNLAKRNLKSEKRRNVMVIVSVVLSAFLISLSGLTGVSLMQTEKKKVIDTYEVILSRLVDTFFSRISLTMQLSPKHHNTVYVLPWEEDLH